MFRIPDHPITMATAWNDFSINNINRPIIFAILVSDHWMIYILENSKWAGHLLITFISYYSCIVTMNE
ncbi:hypothetical protein BLOT_012878 [Blomia tropicalis]|nr:hypothetical protein BLOT_012878 [Blomia tropicalis]